MTYEEIIKQVGDGVSFYTDITNRRFHLGKQDVVTEKTTLEELSVSFEAYKTKEQFLSKFEELYKEYKHSVPSRMSECRLKWFQALDLNDLDDEDMITSQGRDVAQAELELFVLMAILSGYADGWDLFPNPKWFWVSPNDKSLILLKRWFNN